MLVTFTIYNYTNQYPVLDIKASGQTRTSRRSNTSLQAKHFFNTQEFIRVFPIISNFKSHAMALASK